MFARPGLCGMGIGRMGLVAASQPSLVAQALAILAKYGSAANLYLPGVGAINGITAGNWLNSLGITAATVDNPVGLVVSAGKAVGPELVPATAVTSLDGWTANGCTLAIVNGVLELTATRTGVTFADKILVSSGAFGKTYRFGFEGGLGQLGGAFYLGLVAGSVPYTTSDADPVWVADNVFFGLRTRLDATEIGQKAYFSHITTRELPGAHLTQVTTAKQTILRLAGGVFAWQFDGSNDSFTSTMTPGNAGFFCSGANVTDSGVLRTLLGAGAGSDASSGVWLARDASNALTLQVGSGTTRNSVSAAYPVATTAVASAGWDASAMFVGINGTETIGAKSVNCTSTNTMNVGVLTGTTNPMLGTISGGAIIMPTVLPTAYERATLRQFIASLSGVTL